MGEGVFLEVLEREFGGELNYALRGSTQEVNIVWYQGTIESDAELRERERGLEKLITLPIFPTMEISSIDELYCICSLTISPPLAWGHSYPQL